MIIDCIGCLHGNYPHLETGDLLIVTGDLTIRDTENEIENFFKWLHDQPYNKKILIAGNHDTLLQELNREFLELHHKDSKITNIEYLCDSGTEFEGLKIWGSPWISQFKGINPKCTAFTVKYNDHTEELLEECWEKIPEDIDILITHGPPYGILDGIPNEDGSLFHVGSKSLRQSLSRERFPNLKLHVFSHIHEQGGKIIETNFANYVNCSIMNENYRPTNNPIRIIL